MHFQYTPLERRAGEFIVSSDRARLDLDAVHRMLAASYWAANIPRAIVDRSVAGSMAFGLHHAPDDGASTRQVGFGRVITDGATFGYLADVIVEPAYRGRGLGRFLVETMVSHPELEALRRWMLVTRDAHGLYAQVGFVPTAAPANVMERRRPNAHEPPVLAAGQASAPVGRVGE